MSLSTDRRRGYAFGALTGAFAAVAVVAASRRDRSSAVAAAVASVGCGALAVVFEERAQSAEGTDP